MPRSSSSLPPYLTSGASSRSHHGLLVKLNEAASNQEEDEIISGEIKKAREILSVRGQSTSKVSDTLIILLHCLMLRHRTDDDVDFALISALQLAEGGRTLAERKIGYLYLVKRLPKHHELNLLLINTIRKDLSSSTPSHVLLALQIIAKIPSADLSPAVIPLLTSKALLRHKVPAIRQRTLEALVSLHREQHGDLFPLSMNKLLKCLSQEDDLSVLAVVFRVIRHILETNAHHIGTDEEQLYLIERCVEVARKHEVIHGGQVSLEVVKTLRAVVEAHGSMSAGTREKVGQWVTEVLGQMTIGHRWEGALLLELCQLATRVPSTSSSILPHISRLLLADQTAPSSSSSPPQPTANDHILALRCLAILPTTAWDGQLGEKEMGVIMEGVNSVDDTIRKSTIKLLQKLSSELPNMVLQTHLDSIRSSTNLSLPLTLADRLTIEERMKIGKYETASRALEVVEVQYEEDGRRYASGVLDVLDTLNSKTKGKGSVWDEGARRVLARLDHSPRNLAESFTTCLLETLRTRHDPPGDTLLVILTSVTCEYLPFSYRDTQEMIDSFLHILPKYNASVQELILVTIVSLMIRLQPSEVQDKRSAVIEGLRTLQSTSPKYQRKLADTLDAIISVSRKHPHKVPSTSEHTSSPVPPRADLSASQLRYDAYLPPKQTGKGKRQYRDHSEDDSH
uniref:Clathrin/coatomer adaptor adaptin-like N-terminal domain-containing protein n=1 Tax=Kwoniella bestiolae CBS 10118 TaxID=1296100 RepID=A0A1B9G6L9_9TREE|nr:hypothetical protein I302_04371 [Kwoniella bestiolae CBS 10118]OCF26684.1 hypothetical protein I302_04371 [Kwoniella bestiolae CBS 10118]